MAARGLRTSASEGGWRVVGETSRAGKDRMFLTQHVYQHSVCERFLSPQDLIADPLVRLFHSITQADGGLPIDPLQDHRVVAISSADAFRRIEVVLSLQLYLRYVLGNIHKLINGYQFAAAQVDGLENVTFHDGCCTLQTVIDVHEAASLMAVAPDFNLSGAGHQTRSFMYID